MARDCVEWEGAKDAKGYGRLTTNGKWWRAHRWAWTNVYGLIPEGMSVLHHCDNPSCINVDHLFLGTQADNMRDASNKGRMRSGHSDKEYCIRGHKFNEENTLYYQGSRYCRACRRIRERQAIYEGRR